MKGNFQKQEVIPLEEKGSEKIVQSFEKPYKKDEIQSYEFQKIVKKSENKAPLIQAHEGGKDVDVFHKRKDFTFPDFLKKHMGIDQEEEKKFAQEVEKRVQKIEAEVRAKAFEEGKKEGVSLGKAEGLLEIRQWLEDRMRKFDDFLEHAEKALLKIFRENEKWLIHFLFEISKMIALKEIQLDKSYVARLAAEVLEKLGEKENITIMIHPKDIEFLEMIQKDLEKKSGKLKNLKINPSEQVEEGGCIVETEFTYMDASLKQQIKAISEAIFVGRK